MATRRHYFRVRETFPHDDAMSVQIARLSIVLEDLFVALAGMHQEAELRNPDCLYNSDRLTAFFFRNLLVHLNTALSVLDELAPLIGRGELETPDERAAEILAEVQQIHTDLAGARAVEVARHNVAAHLSSRLVEQMLRDYELCATDSFTLSNFIANNERRFAHNFSMRLLRDLEDRWPDQSLPGDAVNFGFRIASVGSRLVALYLAQRRVPAV